LLAKELVNRLVFPENKGELYLKLTTRASLHLYPFAEWPAAKWFPLQTAAISTIAFLCNIMLFFFMNISCKCHAFIL